MWQFNNLTILLTIFGEIRNPFEIFNAPKYAVGPGEAQPFGLIVFLNNALRLFIIAAGLFALIQFIGAGFQYMTAGGDPKAVANAWAKIWQLILGLVLMAAAFTLAALFGYFIFGDPMAILSPKIYGPK